MVDGADGKGAAWLHCMRVALRPCICEAALGQLVGRLLSCSHLSSAVLEAPPIFVGSRQVSTPRHTCVLPSPVHRLQDHCYHASVKASLSAHVRHAVSDRMVHSLSRQCVSAAKRVWFCFCDGPYENGRRTGNASRHAKSQDHPLPDRLTKTTPQR